MRSTNTAIQRLAILRALRTGEKSTIQLRETLGICSPAPRVMELRAQGYDILTNYRYEYDIAGVKHRIGVYLLKSEPQQETQKGHHHDN